MNNQPKDKMKVRTTLKNMLRPVLIDHLKNKLMQKPTENLIPRQTVKSNK